MMLSCQCAWFGIILSMVPLAVLFLFWTRYNCWRCAVLFLGKMQNSMNSEECSRTFPSLVKTQTAMTGAIMLGSKPWISSKESNEDNGKGVMDSSKYLTGSNETDMTVRTFIMNLRSLSFSFQSTVLTLEWHHWVFLTSQLHQIALSLKPRSARIQAFHLRGKCDA
ncbi:unnamed protein product [Sphagnum tenellum]